MSDDDSSVPDGFRQTRTKSQVRWTKDEVAVLHQHGAEMMPHELAELLPRHTTQGIAAKRERLGIILPREYRSRQGSYGRSFVNSDNLCKLDQQITLDDLDNTTLQVLLGSCLGDGCIKRNVSKWNHRNFLFYEGHGSEQRDYVHWKAQMLSELSPLVSPSDRRHEMWTPSHPMFTLLRDKFYPSRTRCKKTLIPLDMIARLDFLGLMVWYLDDGYLGKPKSGLRRNRWRTQAAPSITAKRLDYNQLVQAIGIVNANLGLSLDVVTVRHCGGLNKLVRIRSVDRHRILSRWRQMAEEYDLPSCMYYKLNMHNEEVLSWER